jgi:hypothetical protein
LDLDINGAKALKERLGLKAADEAPAASVDVPEDAPPVYHWLRVAQSAPKDPTADAEDELPANEPSLFRRLGLSFR